MRRFFRAIGRALTNRWFLTFLALLIIAALIWFVGPLVAIGEWIPLESEMARLITILVVLLIWALNRVRVYFRDKRNNAKMVEELAEAQGPAEDPGAEDAAASSEEVAVLKERLQEALGTLKRAKLGSQKRGRRYLYQLPWYLLIGPPGAGKTTALKNSGMKFPLTDQMGRDSIQGVGGTRNCDWWFTEEAVLLDTAGRYTTQDSNQAIDAAAWTGFLGLLKKYRRRQPINGVIVAVSLLDLMRHSAEERKLHARAIRQRLQEVYTELKVPVPVYVWLTKCDLVAGFIEFFDDLGREGREQVWGFTFKLDDLAKPQGVLSAFSAEFDLLIERMEDRLLARIDTERDISRRGLIHGFPVQISLLKQALGDFLTETFEPSRYQERMLLRGVYLTSGTQEGSPIDRLMSSLAQTFGFGRQALPTFSGAGRSYFITRLLRNVMFAESGLGAGTSFFDRHRRWIERGAFALAALVVLIGGLAWWNSYRLNQAYIVQVQDEVEAYNAEADVLSQNVGEIRPILPVLERLRTIPGGFADQDETPSLAMRLGLYQGDKLGGAAVTAYRRVLNKALLPRLAHRLEQQMRGSLEQPELLYEILKTYLMIEDPAVFDPEAIDLWYAFDLDRWLPGPSNLENREKLTVHLAALLDTPLEPPAPDLALVERAREILSEAPPAERAYARLRQRFLNSRDFKAWSISGALGRSANKVFVRVSGKPLNEGIPGLYTVEAYKAIFPTESLQVVKQVGDEAWVIGLDPEQQEEQAPESAGEYLDLQTDVIGLYLEDYARQWDEILRDVRIVEFKDMRHAVEVLQEMTGPNSALRRFFKEFSEQTTLARKGPDLDAAANVSYRLSYWKDRVRRLLAVVPEGSLDEIVQDPGSVIDRRYAEIHELVEADGNNPAGIDDVLSSLQELQEIILDLANSPNRGDAALRQAFGQGTQGAAVLNELDLKSRRQPLPLSDWVVDLRSQGAKLSAVEINTGLSAKLKSDLTRFCRQALANRYPVARDSASDVNLSDFARLFAPGGLFDRFFQDNLASIVDTSSRPWKARGVGGAQVEISPGTLRAFERAQQIRDVFFRGGGDRPRIEFVLKPMSLDQEVSQFLIEVDGQKITYEHGPERGQQLIWPGSDGFGTARFLFNSFEAGRSSGVTKEGPWAFFRLLDGSEMKKTSQRDEFLVIFQSEGFRAIYKMQANSVVNPFRLKALENFHCPGSL